jgi:RNA polymerase sigma-70 factor (ECF subfamily)
VEDRRRIYEEEFTRVWHSLRRHGVPERHLEDAAHEVFTVLYRRLPELDRSRPLGPYLSGIAARVAADLRKRASERYEVPSDQIEQADTGRSPEELLAGAERQRLVGRALEALSHDQRAVFVMHELEGHAIPDVAAALAINLNTAYSRLRLARASFTQAARRLNAEQR